MPDIFTFFSDIFNKTEELDTSGYSIFDLFENADSLPFFVYVVLLFAITAVVLTIWVFNKYHLYKLAILCDIPFPNLSFVPFLNWYIIAGILEKKAPECKIVFKGQRYFMLFSTFLFFIPFIGSYLFILAVIYAYLCKIMLVKYINKSFVNYFLVLVFEAIAYINCRNKLLDDINSNKTESKDKFLSFPAIQNIKRPERKIFSVTPDKNFSA